MWVAKIRLRHNCTIGNRCQKFNCISYSMPLNSWVEKGYRYTSHRHTIESSEGNVKTFIQDLKKDPRVVKVEVAKNTIFLIERRKEGDIPTSHFNPKMFFLQPVYVDKEGFELWAVASWEKKVLIKFISDLEKEKDMEIHIKQIKKDKLDNIYFPRILPRLSPKQKEAYQLALEKRYYENPRKINLQELAKLSKLTTATYHEHLRKAESKIMPKYTIT